MTDAQTVATRYIELWNERDPQRRKQMLTDHWTRDARYIDPLMNGDGAENIATLIGGVHERFPDFRFTLIGEPDGHGDHVRFSWGLGPTGSDHPIEGTDFVQLQDGRIRHVTGFLDRVPA